VGCLGVRAGVSGVHHLSVFVFLGRLERQRIGKLDGDAADVGAEFVDTADFAFTDEVFEVKSVGLVGFGDAESGGDVLAVTGAAIGIAGKGSAAAGHIDHLSLGKNVVKIFRKPDGPTVPQSRFPPSFHYAIHGKSPVFLFFQLNVWCWWCFDGTGRLLNEKNKKMGNLGLIGKIINFVL
jgi:hypothetical protein